MAINPQLCALSHCSHHSGSGSASPLLLGSTHMAINPQLCAHRLFRPVDRCRQLLAAAAGRCHRLRSPAMEPEMHRRDWRSRCRTNRLLEEPEPRAAACAMDRLLEFSATACCVHTKTVEEQAWFLRDGVQNLLVDKQQLSKFLASNCPERRELLQAYTRLWEAEWRLSWLSVMQATKTPAKGNRSASSACKTSRFSTMVSCGSNVLQEDNQNSNMVVNAMRSFFSEAIQMAHLEAAEVQRLIEAFVEALISDASLLRCLSASLLSEGERHPDYQTEEEILFGLTYMTIMLQTDLHNKNVKRKIWDTRKFTEAGRTISVTSGFMSQIYKNVKESPL